MAVKIPDWAKGLVFYPMKPAPCLFLPANVEEWLVEPKYNGWHTVWAIFGGKVVIFSRNLKYDMTDWIGLRHLKAKLSDIEGPMTLTGELVNKWKDPTSIPSLKTIAMPNITVKFFDAFRPGDDNVPLRERRKLLEKIVPVKSWVVEQDLVGSETRLRRKYASYVTSANKEGVVLKNPNSLYFPGQNATLVTKDWLKIRDKTL